MLKALKLAGVCAMLFAVLLGAGFVAWLLFPENAARRPPEFDAIRAEVLKQTQLEADFEYARIRDQPEPHLRVRFLHVPPGANEEAIEKTVRALVRQHLPAVTKVTVHFTSSNLAAPAPPPRPRQQ